METNHNRGAARFASDNRGAARFASDNRGAARFAIHAGTDSRDGQGARGSWASLLMGIRVATLALGLGAVVGLGACHKDDSNTRMYCDNTGCFQCQGDRCYPAPGDPAKPDPSVATACGDDSACGSGRVCNLGRCEASCTSDASCQSGSSCVSGRCRPTGSPTCGVAGAFCTADSQCGAAARCVSGGCAKTCTDGASGCGLGQACVNGACLDDPAPKMAQCQFDFDCHAGKGGFRCVNAACLPTCTDSKACAGTGLSCVKGVCRADRRVVSG